MENQLTIALLQSDLVWESPIQNHDNFSQKIDKLDQQVDLVVLPETFTTGFSMQPEHLAEAMDGPTIAWMQSTARQRNLTIAGSIIIQENDQYHNRLLWVTPDGLVSHYDKKHLFGYAGEDKVFSSGKEKKIINIGGFRVCLNICYDLRFPVWSRNQNDYDVLLYIANWPEVRQQAWSSLLVARAIENQSFVIGVNRVGRDGNGHQYSGDSVLLGPDGSALVSANRHQEETLVYTIQKDDLVAFRDKYPFWRDADEFMIQ